jgi:hypothetical protein
VQQPAQDRESPRAGATNCQALGEAAIFSCRCDLMQDTDARPNSLTGRTRTPADLPRTRASAWRLPNNMDSFTRDHPLCHSQHHNRGTNMLHTPTPAIAV